MTYSLINKCAKNYYNRTFIVQVIAKNVVTCFFLRHSVVDIMFCLNSHHTVVCYTNWNCFFQRFGLQAIV